MLQTLKFRQKKKGKLSYKLVFTLSKFKSTTNYMQRNTFPHNYNILKYTDKLNTCYIGFLWKLISQLVTGYIFHTDLFKKKSDFKKVVLRGRIFYDQFFSFFPPVQNYIKWLYYSAVSIWIILIYNFFKKIVFLHTGDRIQKQFIKEM